ncbi:zinc-binding alcohol dehydrogenase family protein [Anoxynatronum buryatiense]|uniref:2-desacetyl-2-hydroxyethyl bacteriochlorophyllide A dehydrogenase n=1 Tax=Anoxynatronum buryatiense TaxID=489973 RepID=A0AA45WT58_9CLOT|nr:zinc-binding alcohol dehydrogenase family protein [Anoxynatronum buryatiense]SMP40372.1 2-desacetyl-2-hydroxyethyl bacteriochlorophyllide A dehydrogenase [Anoxynatronum buryatiense]
MEATMKVVHIDAPGSIQIVEKPVPTPPKGEALLKVNYCGICGSDIATFTGNQPFATYPRIPGHEFSAEIAAIEPNEAGLEVGMQVTANPYFNCGTCYSCRRGLVNCCQQNETMGVQRDGTFSEYIVMPIERIYSGNGLDAKNIALIEPFTIGYHAANRADIQAGEKVLVLGAGAIGIFAMISARLRGATLYVADFNQTRLDHALQLGATDVVNLGERDLMDAVREWTNGDGMDTVMEAAGIPESFLNAIEAAAFGGKLSLIGNGSRETTFNHSVLLKKELNVFGSRNSLHDFKPLIELVKSGAVAIESMVTHVYPFQDSIQAFEALVQSPADKLKVLIRFD